MRGFFIPHRVDFQISSLGVSVTLEIIVLSPIALDTIITCSASIIKFKIYQEQMELLNIVIDKSIAMISKLKTKKDEIALLKNKIVELNIDNTYIKLNNVGYIDVDVYQRTSVKNIFAIGDIVGNPMLAHKATHEGKVAAEVCAGHPAAMDCQAIPSVVYTDPEVAWAGLTETEAKENEIDYVKGEFPCAASGRAISMDANQGKTKILFDPETKKVLGVGIVGPGAGDMISEAMLSIEMGADAEDISLTIHPHPTVGETFAMAAEVFQGTITDLYVPKK